MIEVKDLQKAYGELMAVKGVSFTARKGSVFGLLGPNGAGKSTTISCICGLLRPTAGTVSVNGFDIVAEAKKAKQSLGCHHVVAEHIAETSL